MQVLEHSDHDKIDNHLILVSHHISSTISHCGLLTMEAGNLGCPMVSFLGNPGNYPYR